MKPKSLQFRVHRLKFLFRTPHSALGNCRGFTYVALLAAIVIIGITLGSATKYWSTVSKRDKEEELLFRGEQYRVAIERYYNAIPGRTQYPASIEDLLKDSRTADGKRYLRRKYKDPITGEDFVEERDLRTKQIVGVHSPSEKEPLKQTNFPATAAIYAEFEGKKKYSEWRFLYLPQGGQQPVISAITSTDTGKSSGF
jgi:type II secretory pathway pseudopilin PulG